MKSICHRSLGAWCSNRCQERCLGPLGWVNATMTTQDRRDSTGGRHVRLKHIPAVQKPPSQLTSSPGRMCRTGRQYRLLNLRWGACRRVVGPPRQVDQACLAPFAEPPKPLVSSRRADPEATAKGPLVGAFSLRHLHELSPLRHNGHLLPWHDHLLLMKSCLLWCPLCLRTCVSYLPGLYMPGRGLGDGRRGFFSTLLEVRIPFCLPTPVGPGPCARYLGRTGLSQLFRNASHRHPYWGWTLRSRLTSRSMLQRTRGQPNDPESMETRPRLSARAPQGQTPEALRSIRSVFSQSGSLPRF